MNIHYWILRKYQILQWNTHTPSPSHRPLRNQPRKNDNILPRHNWKRTSYVADPEGNLIEIGSFEK